MAASPILSGPLIVFPTSSVESLTSMSASSYVGFKEINANGCRNSNEMVSYIRGGDHTAAVLHCCMVQREIDAMVQEIHSKARIKHTLSWSYALRLLAFADEITNLKLSPDKLFVVLKLHRAPSADFVIILQWHPDEFSMIKYNHTLQKLRSAMCNMLQELNVFIQNLYLGCVPSGSGIHDATRHVMNYIRLLLNHRSWVSFILSQEGGTKDRPIYSLDHTVKYLIICLEPMLKKVAEACYDSGGLQCFFLMNNLHFTVKQVDGSQLVSLLANSWVEVHRTLIEKYMEKYLDLPWGPVLSCLNTSRTGMLGGCFGRLSSTAEFCLQFDLTYYKPGVLEGGRSHLREMMRRAVSNMVIYLSLWSIL